MLSYILVYFEILDQLICECGHLNICLFPNEESINYSTYNRSDVVKSEHVLKTISGLVTHDPVIFTLLRQICDTHRLVLFLLFDLFFFFSPLCPAAHL